MTIKSSTKSVKLFKTISFLKSFPNIEYKESKFFTYFSWSKLSDISSGIFLNL